jgi:hypothetical protein
VLRGEHLLKNATGILRAASWSDDQTTGLATPPAFSFTLTQHSEKSIEIRTNAAF